MPPRIKAYVVSDEGL